MAGFNTSYGPGTPLGTWSGDAGWTFGSSTPSAPSTVTTAITIPADPGEPATPEQYVDYPPKGWTSFANSIDSILEGYAEFKVEDNVQGAVVGLTTTPMPEGTEGYGHIRQGILFTDGKIFRVSDGAYMGTYTRDDVFRITYSAMKLGPVDFIPVPSTVPGAPPNQWYTAWADATDMGKFSFKKNGNELWSLNGTVWADALPAVPRWLAVSLYAPQDEVFDPALVPTARSGYSSAQLIGMSSLSGGAGTSESQSFASLEGISASSGVLNKSAAGLGGIDAFSSDRPLAQSIARLPNLRVASYNSLPVTPNNESLAILTGTSASSTGITGGVGNGTAEIIGMQALSADRPYAGSEATLDGLGATSFTYPGGLGVIIPEIGLFDGIQSQAIYKADALFGFGLGITMGASIAANERIDFGFVLDIPVELSTIDVESISPVFWFAAPLECPGAFMDAWAVNLDSGASTEYRSYPFETVANIGGRYFGAAFEGLYELAGDTDAGAPIEAKFDIGRKDFGNKQLKRIEQIYLGITSKGQMMVKVTAEGASYTYPMREFGEHIQTQRVTPGKGMRANYFGFEIGNTAGCEFEITSLDMMVAESARRI